MSHVLHHIFPFLFFVLNAKMSHFWQGFFFLQHNVLQKHAFLFRAGGAFWMGGKGFWKIAIEILRYTLCCKLLHLYFSCFGNLGIKSTDFLCLLLAWGSRTLGCVKALLRSQKHSARTVFSSHWTCAQKRQHYELKTVSGQIYYFAFKKMS